MCWFAAKTKQKGEFKALEFFISMGINSYVPSYTTKRIWSDRIKKVTVPAISGYVFFELPRIDFNLINLNPFTKNIVRDIGGMPAVITDEEMDRHERWIRLENEDKLMDTQRIMAWVAMVATIIAVVVLLTPIVPADRMHAVSGFLNTFIVAQLGVVVGFMGATALSKTKTK